jgi:hypothetical protein
MWAYSRAAFRVVTLGPRRLELPPGTLLIATHRRETDVPVACPSLYARARLWRGRTARERLSGAARDDLFLAGFFAGFPSRLGPRLRRVLYPVGVGSWLPLVHIHPLRSATSARLVELLAEQPDARLGEVLAPGGAVAFAARADALGLAPPVRVADVLRGEFSDLLWRAVTPPDPAAPASFWTRRAAQAAADFRFLVALLQAGGRLLVFPEGRPSPDGEIGPVQRGLGALVRRGRPSALLPIGIAYDPLVRGRTRALVHLDAPVRPPGEDVEQAALALLRRAVPLTAGQIVAAAAEPDEAVEAAKAEGRAVDPRLEREETRRAAVAEARRQAARRPHELPYLAREFRSARLDGVPGGTATEEAR